uniref:CARD domain-containing protein n=1 Tax=Oreochromis aureus TaxID=47969 RepID=A0AAZ1WXM9_OREAU
MGFKKFQYLGQLCQEGHQIKEARVPCSSLLTYHRELLVTRLRSIQCILDNLFTCGFFCQEDVEIVQQTATKADQVRKILELVQLCDAYIDLQPWLKEINYNPSEDVTVMKVVNTDPSRCHYL